MKKKTKKNKKKTDIQTYKKNEKAGPYEEHISYCKLLEVTYKMCLAYLN